MRASVLAVFGALAMSCAPADPADLARGASPITAGVPTEGAPAVVGISGSGELLHADVVVSQSWFDGANCKLPDIPQNRGPFIWNNAMYYSCQ